MAIFEIEFNKTMGHEGGYSYDPDDVGGETYKGIARRYHKGWSGWNIVDSLNDNLDFPNCLNRNEELQFKVKSFYKQHFWDRFQGDLIHDQSIAGELFDTGVNMGLKRAVKFLQRSLNYLNRNGNLFPDMVDDGVLGRGTLKCLNYYLNRDNPEILLKIMNVLQGQHYLNYMSKSPRQEKYCRGWFNRVTLSKGY
jgi:lysozyme family protein